MPSYRVYRLDGAGNIVGADWLEAQEDEDALREVHERLDGARFELWDRNRLVSSSRGAGTPRSRN